MRIRTKNIPVTDTEIIKQGRPIKAVGIFHYSSANPLVVKVVAGTLFDDYSRSAHADFEVWREDLEAALAGSPLPVDQENAPLQISIDNGLIHLSYMKDKNIIVSVVLNKRMQRKLNRALNSICSDLGQASSSLTDKALSSLLAKE